MTLEKYPRTLRQALCGMFGEMPGGGLESRVVRFVRYGRENPEWMRGLPLSLSHMPCERTRLPHDSGDCPNPVSFASYFKPIRKLFDMNGVATSRRRICATCPELDNVPDGGGRTRREIRRMLRFAGTSRTAP